MKEATGETSMTMITLVAIGVIAGILAFMWPMISNWIQDSFNNTVTRGNCTTDPVTGVTTCN